MSTENRVSVAARLREERDRLGLSQAEMAALGDTKARTYQDWERAVASVSADFLGAVAGHGLDVTYVLTGNRVSLGPLSTDESQLIERFRSGSPTLSGYLQELRAASHHSPASSRVQVGGDVGQVVAGDASFAAPMSFSLGSKKKKS